MSHSFVKPNLSLVDKHPLSQTKNCQFHLKFGTRPTSKRSLRGLMTDGGPYARLQSEIPRKKRFLQSLKSNHNLCGSLDQAMIADGLHRRNLHQSIVTCDSADSTSTRNIVTSQKSNGNAQVSELKEEMLHCPSPHLTKDISSRLLDSNLKRERRNDKETEIWDSAVSIRISRVIFRAKRCVLCSLKDKKRSILWEKPKLKRTKKSSFSNSTTKFTNSTSIFFIFLLMTFHCNFASAIPIRWDLGPFSPCSVTCGRGVQNRSVVCREMPEGLNHSSSSPYRPKGNQMPDMMCPAPKPHETQDCSQTACDPEWEYGAWGKCSKSCGRGMQLRTRRCFQKLGTGKTVRVHDHYCPENKSFLKRHCNQRRYCPPRWMVFQWKPCPTTCGSSFQSRIVFCGQYKAGHSRPTRVPLKKCLLNAKPSSRKICHMHKCANTPHPTIRTGNQDYIQEGEQIKVRLLVGQQATVLSGTIVIIKCLVDDFPKNAIEWYFSGQQIPRNGTNGVKLRVSVLDDGTLRIIRAKLADSGLYTCSAGSSSASSSISVISQPESNDLDSAPLDDDLDISESANILPKTRVAFKEGLDFDENLNPGNYKALPRSFSSNTDPILRVRHPPKLLQTPQPPPEVLHPQLSFLVSRPIPQIQPRALFSHSGRNGFRNSIPRRHSSNKEDHSKDLVASILQFMDEEGVDGASGSLSALLDQTVEISSLFERGEISEAERNRRIRNILAELNLHLENDRNRISLRGNFARSTKVVRLRRIVQILEAQVQFKPAAIIPQPTLAPLQLGREVTAYVGGHLMVADAKRITILCEASGIPVPEISWYRNGNKLPEHRRQMILHEGSLRLFFPQLSDSGVYKCLASNSGGNASSSTDLSVMQKPRILSTTSTLEDFSSDVVEATVGSDIRAKLGAKVIIHCPTEGYPDPFVVWRKDASGLGQNTNVMLDNSLEIYPATAAYQGLFGCEASNPAGSDYQASSLVLIDPPRISEELSVLSDVDGAFGLPGLLVTGVRTEHYDVKANSTVMMGCPVTGFPSPTITWLFNDQPLDHDNSNFEYQLMKEDKILQIPKADYTTEGTFSCLAENDGGNLTTRLRLNLIVYSYQFGELSPCSASCGGNGLNFRQLKCMQDGIKEVQEWYCLGLVRPPITFLPCNRKDCQPRFVAGTWSSCSSTCGNGTRSRAPSCEILMSDGTTRAVAAEECLRFENRTVEMEFCFERKCPEWRSGPWKPCSRKCMDRGVGLKTRKVNCVDAEGQKVNPKQCPNYPKPKRKAHCPNFRCEPVWVTSRWSVCSPSCGNNGIKTRIVNCVYQGRKRQPAGNKCSNRRVPVITLPCNRKSCIGKDGECKDKYGWCIRVKKLGLCTKTLHSRSCCESCKSSAKR